MTGDSPSRTPWAQPNGHSRLTVVMAIALVLNGAVLLLLIAGPRWSPLRSIAGVDLARGDAGEASADRLLGRLDALEQRVERLRLGQFHDAFDRVVEGAANDQERCIRIARHIAANMGNHFVDDRTGASTSDVLSWWESRKGLCNARANVMIKALRRYNIEARLWNIYDYDFGHSAVQAYYDGAWHYFDPTYAGCFLDEDGTVMSWDQIVAEPETAVRGMVVFEAPWDKDDDGARFSPEERMRLVYAPEQLARVKAAGEPWSSSFRLPVQLRVPAEGEDAVWFGRIDGDAWDLRSTTPLGLEVLEATRCKYLDALGMYHENFMHELTLDGVDADARYRLTWHFLPERQGPATLIARSSTGRIIEGADGPVCSEAEQWTFVYEPGAGEEHRIEVGLSDDEIRSYVRVDALAVERISNAR